MTRIWQHEKKPILGALAALLASGLATQSWTLSTLIVLAAYIIWLYYRLERLENWLARGTKTHEVYDD